MGSQPFQTRIARQFPPNYRSEIVPRVLGLIAKGESCFIVGASGVGKSNFFRFLWNEETQARYLTDADKTFVFIWADTNGLAGELSAFYVYELVLYNLQKWVEDNPGLGAAPDFFRELHEKVVIHKDRVLAQRHLETALRHLFNQIDNLHVVLLFDEFEPIVRELDFQFFRSLRWLRDEFKYHLSYVMAAHRSPIAIREEFFDAGEPLYELLAANIMGLKPYNPADSEFMVAELSTRYEVALSDSKKEIVLRLSGGHGGLISAIFKILIKQSLPRQAEAQVEQLLSFDSVAGECRKVWNSLESVEQDVLVDLVKADFAPQQRLPLNSLVAKGIILPDTAIITLFSPLFREFLRAVVPAMVDRRP